MYVLAVTGGVASGKSLFTQIFSELAKGKVECFDCDASVHELLKESEILEELRNRFGSGVFDNDGGLNRQRMGERVFASASDRKDLEGMLHPRVLEMAQRELKEIGRREVPPDYLLFEVPLLYEVDFFLQRDTDVVVAASRGIQRKRLKEQRGMDDEMISQVLNAQLPMEEKISRAQQVIWNDASDTELLEAAHLLKVWIDKKVG